MSVSAAIPMRWLRTGTGSRMPSCISTWCLAPPAMRQRRSAGSISSSMTARRKRRFPSRRACRSSKVRPAPRRASRPGLDPTTLWTLLKTLNRPGVEGKTSLKGRLEVRTGVEAHELAGARPQRSAIAIPAIGRERPGVPERHGVRRRPHRHTGTLWRQRKGLELRLLDRIDRRLLCHRRHQDHVSGCSFCPRSASAASPCPSVI